MNDGFFRVAACVPRVTLGDPASNADAILGLMREAYGKGADLAVFPELSLTGYTCGDLFHQSLLLEGSERELLRLARATADMPGLHAVVGAPRLRQGSLYNTAFLLRDGEVEAEVAKTYLPNYNEFYERRLWTPALADDNAVVVECSGVQVGIEICEDLWAPLPPSTMLAMGGAEVIVNLSASDDLVGKYDYLRNLVIGQSGRCLCGYVYASAGQGESSQDLVFDGKGLIAECGKLLGSTRRWEEAPMMIVRDIDIEAIRHDRLHLGTFAACARRTEGDSVAFGDMTHLTDPAHHTHGAARDPRDRGELLREISPRPFVPSNRETLDRRADEIVHIQTAGLAQRLRVTGCRCLVVGVSGGLDSTLALLVAAEAFDSLGLDRKGIVGVTMPGYGTTGRTHRNALDMMRLLGVTMREIPIGQAVAQHFGDIGHDPELRDVTYENAQARERTQILMDLANQLSGMVLGTGDLSELALGWATYNGDHMSMYGVNASVPKTLVRFLVEWFARHADNDALRVALLDIAATPISPELIPADAQGNITQKTEDLVGPYELHDFFLYYTLRYGFTPQRVFLMARKAFSDDGCRYDEATILRWMKTFYRRFFAQQFKRSCLPDGPKVGSVCLSPRGDWRMPSDASPALWLRQAEELENGLSKENSASKT